MHAHVKVVDKAPELWPDLDRETHMKNGGGFFFFPPSVVGVLTGPSKR